MSLAVMVFFAAPVISPSFGQAVMLLTHWRGIIVLLVLYGAINSPEARCACRRRCPRRCVSRSRFREFSRHSTGPSATARRSAMRSRPACRVQYLPSCCARNRSSPRSSSLEIVSSRFRRRRDRRFRQLPHRPARHARVVSHAALTGFAGRGRAAGRREEAHSVPAAVHRARAANDGRLRINVGELHCARDGAAG